MIDLKNDISIVIAGEAGQGVQTVETLFMRLAKLSGLNVFATKEYMSRVRGGSNSTEIRISSKKKEAFLERIDILIALDANVFDHLSTRISKNTLMILQMVQLHFMNLETSLIFVVVPIYPIPG